MREVAGEGRKMKETEGETVKDDSQRENESTKDRRRNLQSLGKIR